MVARILFRPKGLLLTAAAATTMFAFACGTDAASPPTTTPPPRTPTVTPVPPTSTPTVPPTTPTPFVDFHPVLGQSFKLLLDENAILNGDGARIRFVRIVSDNRCPLDVTCVTGGAVVVEMAVRLSPSSPEEMMLWSIGADRMEPSVRSIAGLDVELLEVEPVPGGDNPDGLLQVELVVTQTPHAPTLTLDANVSDDEIGVGETFVVTTDAGGSGIPQYTLWVGDVAVSVLGYSGEEVRNAESDMVTVVSFDSDMTSATWVLKALTEGEIDLKVSVNGEVKAGPDGPFVFRSGEKSLEVTVSS